MSRYRQHSNRYDYDEVRSKENKNKPEYVIQHPPTRDVSCQTSTNYVVQPQPKQIKHLRNKQPIGYVTKEESANKKDFQRQDYTDYPQIYVIQRPSTRNVRCQMRTHYIIQPQPKKRKRSRNKQTQVVPQPDPPSLRTPTPLPDNIEVIIYYDEDFESLYPRSRKNSCQFVHYIDLRQPDTLEPIPIEVFGHDIVSQLKKKGYIHDKASVDDGLNTMNNSMERQRTVERFCHEGEQLKNSTLAEMQENNFINQTIVFDYR